MVEIEQKFALKPHHCSTDGNIKVFSLLEYLQEIATGHALPETIKRLAPDNDYEFLDQIRVPHSSIDMNGYVNDTEYIRLAVDWLKRKIETNGDFRTVQATYLATGSEDNLLDLLIDGTTSLSYDIWLRKADSKKSALIIEMNESDWCVIYEQDGLTVVK